MCLCTSNECDGKMVVKFVKWMVFWSCARCLSLVEYSLNILCKQSEADCIRAEHERWLYHCLVHVLFDSVCILVGKLSRSFTLAHTRTLASAGWHTWANIECDTEAETDTEPEPTIYSIERTIRIKQLRLWLWRRRRRRYCNALP